MYPPEELRLSIVASHPFTANHCAALPAMLCSTVNDDKIVYAVLKAQ